MPLYTFELLQGTAPLSDDKGVYLPDRAMALAYGKEVARELMRGREGQTRSWRLDIYEDHRERVFELSFAAIDHTLDHLVPDLRTMVERLCNNYRTWREAVHAAGLTVRESRALVARSRGKPYLAAVAGKQTIR
jgi:hypothetical protein